MKKISSLLMLFAAIALMTACSSDDTIVQENGVGKVTVQIKGGATTAVSRATQAGTQAENEIKSLEIYVFNSDGSLDTKVGQTTTAAGTGYVSIPTASLTAGHQYQFQVTAGTGKKVLAIANASLGPQAGKNFLAVEQTLITAAYGSANSAIVDATNGMPMSGVAEGWSVENGAVIAVDVKISRLAAKIIAPEPNATGVTVDFTKLRQVDIDDIFGTGSGLTPADTYTYQYQGYAVINGLKNSAAYTPADFSTWVTDTYYKPGATAGAAPAVNLYNWPTFNSSGAFAAPPYSGGSTAPYIVTAQQVPAVYAWANKPATGVDAGGQIGYVSGTVYAYIIAGTVTGSNTTGVTNKVSSTRYWRINIYSTTTTIGTDAIPYIITRNTIYNTTINKVSSKGYPTVEDAAGGHEEILPPPTAAAANFTIEPQDWEVLTENTEM
jgi:hypothetical protein